MNTNTGEIYEVREDFLRQPLVATTPDEIEMLAAMVRGDTVVPVSEAVVQKVRLGERELARRQARRSAAKQARKRNR